MLAATRFQASYTSGLGISKGLAVGRGSSCFTVVTLPWLTNHLGLPSWHTDNYLGR